MCKSSLQNLSSELAGDLNFHFHIVFLHTHTIPHIFCVQSRWDPQNCQILTILNLRSKSPRFCAQPFKYICLTHSYLNFSKNLYEKIGYCWFIRKSGENKIDLSELVEKNILTSFTQRTEGTLNLNLLAHPYGVVFFESLKHTKHHWIQKSSFKFTP